MSITGVKSYSTANIQGENTSSETANINARLTIDELAITSLQQTVTGFSYNTTGDLTTIDNNLTVTNKLKCSNAPTANEDVANKTYVDTTVANLVASAPATLDTLNELATALGNDANFSTTVTNLIAGKASLSANQTITGINTLSNTANVYYGDGTNLTGVSSSTVGLTVDANTGNWALPFSKTSTSTGNILYVNNPATNTSLTYNANSGRLSAVDYSIGSRNQTAGQNTSRITHATTSLTYVNNATSGIQRFYVNNPSNVQVNPFNINSANSEFLLPYKIFDSGGSNNTTVTQTLATLSLDFTQAHNSGSYNFTSKTAAGVSKTMKFANATLWTELIYLQDTGGGLPQLRHTFTSPTYSIDNTATSGNIQFKTNDASNASTTPLTINSTNCSFTQPPLCSVAATTANMLCNKTYVDSVKTYADTNFVTVTGVQTAITGQKTFTNGANVFYGSGGLLSGVVNTTSIQSVAGSKTFTSDAIFQGNVFFTGGSYNSTIDQATNYLNITNNSLFNSVVSITGLIPSINTSCIVRTDAVTAVNGNAAVTGVNITGSITNPTYNTFLNNFYVTGTTSGTADITIVTLTTIQSTSAQPLGTFFTTFIGTKFALGTYLTADLGNGVYSINQNALVSSGIKTATGIAYIGLNRPFTAGGAAAGTISLDYNTAINVQCQNTASLNLNAIQVKPKTVTSEVAIFGDLKCQGALKYLFGDQITATSTLAWPLRQLYLMNNAAAITVTFPTAIAEYTGVFCIFKRFSTAGGAVTFNQTGGASVIVGATVLGPTASVSLATGTFQCSFFCTGTAWFQMN